MFDSKDEGYEDPDILKAIILANQGQVIPNDLKERIRNKSIYKDVKKEKKDS